MSLNRSVSPLVLAPIFFILLWSGCQQQAPPAPTPTAVTTPAEPTVYKGQALGEEVNLLRGTTLVMVTEELTQKAVEAGAPEGVYFLLLSPTAPDKAVIVKAPEGFNAQEAAAQQSAQVEVSGKTMVIEGTALGDFAKERYTVELAHNEKGVIWIDNTLELPWEKKVSDGEK